MPRLWGGAMPDLTCAGCGKQMRRNARSLPQGQAKCGPCRGMKPSLPCADCGTLLWRNSASSLPEGQARCRPCRRARPTRTPPPPSTPYRICSHCKSPYAPVKHTQRFCSTECRTAKMGQPQSKKPKNRSKASTTARGYGSAHQRERRRWAAVVDAGNAYCWRCGGHIPPASRWDLGHDDHDRTIYRGPEHTGCNRSAGARKGGQRKALRALIGVPERPADTSWRW